MAIRDTITLGKAVLGLGVVIAVVAIALFLAISNNWWRGQDGDIPQLAREQPPSHELVRDANGRLVKPDTIRLSKEAVQGLRVATQPVRAAGNLLLPPQVGTLGYDTDRLYAIRPRFDGEIIEIAKVKEFHRLDGSAEKVETTRLIGPDDWIEKGQLLAVVWSKELGDRKVNYINALLDWYLDRQLLESQEQYAGVVPAATLEATRNKVQKDIAAVRAAETSLGIARVTTQEINQVRDEADAIHKRLQGKAESPAERLTRLATEVPRWARVELRAPHGGKVVEKNTNLYDMVSPSKDTPLFRIADLSTLLINVNFNEEYLPLLQPLMRRQNGWVFLDGLRKYFDPGPAAQADAQELRWKVQIQADTAVPLLDLSVLRVAPSLDPNNHTAMVVGRINNPVKDSNGQDKHLIVGQFVTATVVVPPGPGLVVIPTNALNEVNGESLVLVQPDPKKPEYVLRRLAVVRRTTDWTQVRGELTPRDLALSADEVRAGRRPIEPLHVGELLVTHGVTEITEAFDALLAKARATKK
jgi:membrane fusion protein, heavy metal efflux system